MKMLCYQAIDSGRTAFPNKQCMVHKSTVIFSTT